jgi:hypothetical protein
LHNSPDIRRAQAVARIQQRYYEEVLLHGSQRPVKESYSIGHLRLQGRSMAVGVLALACELRDAFCVAAGFATELLPLGGDAVASWMGTFWRCIHRISFDRLYGSLKRGEVTAANGERERVYAADTCRLATARHRLWFWSCHGSDLHGLVGVRCG